MDTPEGDVTRPKLACLHHLDPPYPGAATAALGGASLEHFHAHRGDRLPRPEDVDGIIVFGGAESVTEIDRYPYLLDEMALLHEAVAQDVPALGICLGAQVLAHALGGRVRRLPRRAVRWVELERIADDELTPERVWALHWNEDGIEPPPGATELLDRGGLGCAGFRLGSGWASSSTPTSTPSRSTGGTSATETGSWRPASIRRRRAPRTTSTSPASPRPRRRSSAASSDALEQREPVP
jgi:GMP synthase-like glutamine amidotransferase